VFKKIINSEDWCRLFHYKSWVNINKVSGEMTCKCGRLYRVIDIGDRKLFKANGRLY